MLLEFQAAFFITLKTNQKKSPKSNLDKTNDRKRKSQNLINTTFSIRTLILF